MKLYNMNLSNFASRCRIVIFEKNADVEIVPIPGGDLKSPEYLKIHPLGKTPSLEVNGQVIGESEVIDEYLEEKFPDPALLPKDPETRARVRFLSRFHDLYFEPPLRALFPQVQAKEKDSKLIQEKLGEVATRLDQLDKLVDGSPWAVGSAFTLADCTFAPTFFFASLMLPMLGGPGFADDQPRIAAWWKELQKHPSVARVLREQQEALEQMMGGGR